jgi:uncharacterized protein (TIGR00159 family)
MFSLFAFLQSIGWQDLIDIGLNSYVLFRLYVLFRGTNVLRILIGIAVLWVMQRLAASLGLVVTSWVFQGIMAAAALIIIVVFRNEIRSVLQAKNLGAILWGFPKSVGETGIQTIVESAYELAQRKIGALIVLPGREGLKAFIDGGMEWDGAVSKEMLLSIFWPENPVHDGAAVIRGNRVSEVGAILPLSSRKDFPSYFGTRHRAAAGLAEATDALVVVVSEEKGNVAVAKGQEVTVSKGKDALARMLHDHLGTPAKQEKHFETRKLELTAAAIISILFISGVWYGFTKGLDTLITLKVPIEYMNRDPKMEIFDTSVNATEISLSGSGALLKSIQPEHIQIKIDLAKAVRGTNSYTITQENITLPPGTSLKKIEPQSVDVIMDTFAQKELPVQVDWVGKLEPGLVLTKATVSPPRVLIIGGSQILKDMSTIYTEKVSLEGIKKSGSTAVKLALHPASLKLPPDAKDRVTVVYEVKKTKKQP